MDDPLAVGAVEGLRDLDPVAQGLLEGKRAPLQPLGEGLAFQVLHDQVVDPILPAEVVEDADVGMIQGGDGPGLTLEALAQVRASCQLRREDLDRHRPIEPRVPGPVDLAHAAGAEQRGDLVRPEARAGVEGHCAK